MDRSTLGVIARSSKPDERRVPIHPAHLARLAPEVRARLHLERGYGERFGVGDAQLAALVGGLGTREQLIRDCDTILLPKPSADDLARLRPGQTLWGWPHCVQDAALTQVAIDRQLTLIAFEAMNHWHRDGSFALHVFHKNNELAGYCSVLHALQLRGTTGVYGRRLRAAVIGFGATARGAVTALNAHGVHDVDVLTVRDVAAVGSPIHSARIVHVDHAGAVPDRSHAIVSGVPVPLPRFLAEHDVIVNCVLQDPNGPLLFLTDDDLPALLPGTIVVDVSCDEGMGFGWARPTSFAEPMFEIAPGVHHYGVDHSPSYLWDAASWEISEALLPYVKTVLGGPDAWDDDEVVRRAIEIRDGVIQNPAVLAFQDRDPEPPHARR